VRRDRERSDERENLVYGLGLEVRETDLDQVECNVLLIDTLLVSLGDALQVDDEVECVFG